MHREAMQWIGAHADATATSVLDIGGRDINGSPRRLFPAATTYVVLDIADGPNVDVVADAATWAPDREYDVVVAAEVFEHTAVWREIVATAYKALRPGGRLIVTTAAPGRPEHSAVDGGLRLYPGEHYANIEPAELRTVLEQCGYADVAVDVQKFPADVRAVARR